MTGKKNGHDRHSANYETIPLDKLRKTRRGKHHDFVAGVMADLEALRRGHAIKIPLSELKDTSVVKLRAAVNRASDARGIKIATSSDADNFYIWRQSD